MEDEQKKEDENHNKSWREKVVWGVKELLCYLGIHSYPKENKIYSYGHYVYYGKRCNTCRKEK